eukprot:jgi/Bigna1/77874/fgenesh1_pg.51_\
MSLGRGGQSSELKAIIHEKNILKNVKKLENFFTYAYHHHTAYIDAFRKDFEEVLEKLFGSFNDLNSLGWLGDVGAEVSEKTLLRLFSSDSFFFKTLLDLDSKYVQGSSKGIRVPFSRLPFPAVKELREQSRYSTRSSADGRRNSRSKISKLYHHRVGSDMVEMRYLEYYFFRFFVYMDEKTRPVTPQQRRHISAGDGRGVAVEEFHRSRDTILQAE